MTDTMAKVASGAGRTPIEIGFTIYSVTNIDPVSQSYDADLKIFCRWHDGGMARDPDMVSLAQDGCFSNGAVLPRDANGRWPHYIVKEIDAALVEHSRPHYQFANASDVSAVEGTLVTYLSPNDKPGFVRSEERFRGTFFQQMELRAFPFHAQTLKINLRLPRRSDAGRMFVQFHNSVGPQIEMKDWVRLSEWIRYAPEANTYTDSKGRARYTISIPLVRRYQYYVWSILLVMCGVSFLAFVSFAINADDLPGRSSHVLTLLLTAVAFKLVISDILPKVSYWTILDIYVNCMFFMMLVIAVENGMVGLVASRAPHLFEEFELPLEVGTAALVITAWAAFHVWFVCYIVATRRSETQHLANKLTGSEATAALHEKRRVEWQQHSAGYEPLGAGEPKLLGDANGEPLLRA